MWLDFDVRVNNRWSFSLEDVLLWTRILAGSNGLKLKTSQCWICLSFCLLQMLTDGLEWCGLLWCFYQLFGLSFWRHPFTAEHPLVRHWCSATFLQIWWRNKLIYILDGLRVRTFSEAFHFWVNYSFNSCFWCYYEWFISDIIHVSCWM